MDQSIAHGSEGPTPESRSVAVVEAVAAGETVDPLELDRPLHDVAATDALDEPFPLDHEGRPGGEGFATFVYGDRPVRVSSDREVRILVPGMARGGGTDAEDP